MTQLLVIIVVALLVIAVSTMIGPRLGIAAPLVLVVVGVAVSFLPVFTHLEIEPEWILEGVLPPLLYSSAVSMPSMNFRREFGAISGLSVLLVVGSALLLGLFFMVAIPGLGFAWGVALGAVISPTDAVATSIIKKTSTSKRVVAILDGESLLNDATALVLLRTAILAAAATFSLWGTIGTFAYSVVVAVVLGWLVGWLNLIVRKRVSDPTVNTVISFTVPFVAAVPAEALGASGLVAAVVAGVITGIRAPRDLSPQNRLSDSQNWRTVELVLEGAVFLTMGLQLKSILEQVERDHGGVGTAVLIALAALALTVLVRAAFVAPLLWLLGRRVRRNSRMQPRLEGLQEQMTTPVGQQETLEKMNSRGRSATVRDLDRFAGRIRMVLADIDYFRRERLGWREGLTVVWAGMRGAVTVAAVQTLSTDAPQRSVLVLIAFCVAGFSLLVQGGTIGPLVRLLTPKADPSALEKQNSEERAKIMQLMRSSAEGIPRPPRHEGEPTIESIKAQRDYRLAVITAQREELLDARDHGIFDADVLAALLENLDASQITMEMRGRRS